MQPLRVSINKVDASSGTRKETSVLKGHGQASELVIRFDSPNGNPLNFEIEGAFVGGDPGAIGGIGGVPNAELFVKDGVGSGWTRVLIHQAQENLVVDSEPKITIDVPDSRTTENP